MSNNIPIDVIQMKRLLEECGFEDGQYDPQIINQMLEFIGADVGDVLKSADVIREHNKHTAIDDYDITLASRVSLRQTLPPRQEAVLNRATRVNASKLPDVIKHGSLVLPPSHQAKMTQDFSIEPYPDQ